MLTLNGLDADLPAYRQIYRDMQESLAGNSTERIVFFSESLDSQRFSVHALESAYLDLFANKYRAIQVDVVIVVSQNALEFFKRHGEQLWPGARMVYVGSPGESVGIRDLPSSAYGVFSDSNIERTVNLAMRLQPDATHVLVVSGVSDQDKRIEQTLREALSKSADKTTTEYLSGLPLPELISRVSRVSRDTIVLYGEQFRDRNDRPYVPREVLRAFSEYSPAPVYSGTTEAYLGFGLTAGDMEFAEDKGRLIAEAVRKLLSKASGPGPVLVKVPTRCVADARLLKHWSLDTDRLPSGCEIRFAERSWWRDNLWQILVGLAIIVGQTLLIVSLLVQRSRRRRAESESLQRLSEMAHMNRGMAIAEISASIAHELSQPLGAILRNAEAGEMFLDQQPPDLDEVRSILIDIRHDDQRAGDVIDRLRALLKRRSIVAQSLSVKDLLDNVASLTHIDCSARGVQVQIENPEEPLRVMGDAVHLQQVLLNLVLNATDAVQDLAADRRRVIIGVNRHGNKLLEFSVSDLGLGIQPELSNRVFEPFFTTKSNGMGIGLSISRTIIEAHGGRLWAENNAQQGATFRFTLPLAQASTPS